MENGKLFSNHLKLPKRENLKAKSFFRSSDIAKIVFKVLSHKAFRMCFTFGVRFFRWWHMNLNCTDDYDVAKIKVKSVNWSSVGYLKMCAILQERKNEKTVWRHSESITPITQHTTDFGHNHKKAPAQCKSKRSLATWTSREQNNQLTNMLSSWQLCWQKILQEDLDDSIMSSRYVRVYKNRALADMHRTEDISNDELKIIPIYFCSITVKQTIINQVSCKRKYR